jgi:hypothetical protein
MFCSSPEEQKDIMTIFELTDMNTLFWDYQVSCCIIDCCLHTHTATYTGMDI